MKINKVNISIETTNAAFGESKVDVEYEVTRILKKVIIEIEEGFGLISSALMDANGNKVGELQVSYRDE